MNGEQRERIIQLLIDKLIPIVQNQTFFTKEGILSTDFYRDGYLAVTIVTNNDWNYRSELFEFHPTHYAQNSNVKDLKKHCKLRYDESKINPAVKPLLDKAIDTITKEGKLMQDKIDIILSDPSLISDNTNILNCKQRIEKLKQQLEQYELSRSTKIDTLMNKIL